MGALVVAVERWLAIYHPDAVFEPQVAALEGRVLGARWPEAVFR